MEFHTAPLPPEEARRLLAAIRKPGKSARFVPRAGDGCVVSEVRRYKLTRAELAAVRLPDYCSSIDIDASGLFDARRLPERLFLRDRDWAPPEKSARMGLFANFRSRRMKCVLGINLTRNLREAYVLPGGDWGVGPRHTWDACEFVGGAGDTARGLPGYRGLDEERAAAGPEGLRAGLDHYRRIFRLPPPEAPGVIEFEESEFVVKWKTERGLPWWEGSEQTLRRACAEDAEGPVLLWSSVNHGGTSTFLKGPENIVGQLRETLDLAAESEYETFSLTYNTVKSETWSKREKRRARCGEGESVLQELGALELPGCPPAEAKLIIRPEGYVFSLEFPPVEGPDAPAFSFAETRLFRKADWRPGEE